jgi:hypothetical protein
MVETATDLEVFGQVPVQMTELMAEMGLTENMEKMIRDGYGPGGLRPSAGPNDRDGTDGKAGFDGKDSRRLRTWSLRPSAGPNDRYGRDGPTENREKMVETARTWGLRPSAGRPNNRDKLTDLEPAFTTVTADGRGSEVETGRPNEGLEPARRP